MLTASYSHSVVRSSLEAYTSRFGSRDRRLYSERTLTALLPSPTSPSTRPRAGSRPRPGPPNFQRSPRSDSPRRVTAFHPPRQPASGGLVAHLPATTASRRRSLFTSARHRHRHRHRLSGHAEEEEPLRRTTSPGEKVLRASGLTSQLAEQPVDVTVS